MLDGRFDMFSLPLRRRREASTGGLPSRVNLGLSGALDAYGIIRACSENRPRAGHNGFEEPKRE